jgi:hypothetical protein
VIANIARSPSCSCTSHRSGRSRGSLELPRVLESEKKRTISAPEPAEGGQIPTSPSEQHTARNHVLTHEMSAGMAVGAALKDSRGQWSDGNWLIAIFSMLWPSSIQALFFAYDGNDKSDVGGTTYFGCLVPVTFLRIDQSSTMIVMDGARSRT